MDSLAVRQCNNAQILAKRRYVTPAAHSSALFGITPFRIRQYGLYPMILEIGALGHHLLSEVPGGFPLHSQHPSTTRESAVALVNKRVFSRVGAQQVETMTGRLVWLGG